MLVDNNDVISNIRQLLTSTHPAVPVAMYLFGLNFQIELLLNTCCEYMNKLNYRISIRE